MTPTHPTTTNNDGCRNAIIQWVVRARLQTEYRHPPSIRWGRTNKQPLILYSWNNGTFSAILLILIYLWWSRVIFHSTTECKLCVILQIVKRIVKQVNAMDAPLASWFTGWRTASWSYRNNNLAISTCKFMGVTLASEIHFCCVGWRKAREN